MTDQCTPNLPELKVEGNVWFVRSEEAEVCREELCREEVCRDIRLLLAGDCWDPWAMGHTPPPTSSDLDRCSPKEELSSATTQ